MKENIYVNKISDTKYEIITKDIKIEPGVFTLYNVDWNLFVLRKKYTAYNKDNKKEDKDGKEELIEIKENDNKEDEKKEWIKRALELKSQLIERGFMSIVNIEDVRKISYVTRDEINQNEILGIRGFDGNYYIFKRDVFEDLKNKLFLVLKNVNTTLSELLEKTDIDATKIKGVLEILKDQSEVIEVSKDVFRRV